MTRIAVLGANGQVGAELCLLLARQQEIEVVPVCRSRMGSAYLRYRGLACRHGQAADPAQAKELYGDCDVIANLALVGTLANPHAAWRTNQSILRNIALHSMPTARHIYFSTMSVYGDAKQGERFPIRNSYGQDKWRSEKLVRSFDSRRSRRSHIFRLGHVCGELQGITHQIRQQVRNQKIPVADPNRLSNTVYVATIADAILKVADDRIPSGTYDLMNVPQWTWRQVFAYEARALGLPFEFEIVGSERLRLRDRIRKRLVAFAVECASNPWLRRGTSRLAARLPINLFRTVKATHAVQSAAKEIRSLKRGRHPLDAVLRAPVGSKFAPGLVATESLLSDSSFRIQDETNVGIWPSDLPPARISKDIDTHFVELASEAQ